MKRCKGSVHADNYNVFEPDATSVKIKPFATKMQHDNQPWNRKSAAFDLRRALFALNEAQCI